jgi:signal transduction histidine kinase/CheY-like chemotaxis protein
MDQDLIDALARQHIDFDEPNVALVFAQRDAIQIADLKEEASSDLNEITLRAGYRARLVAPLLRGDDVVGMLVVRRKTPGAFPQNTVDLIKTFAAQSVLAIQNARLFHEIEEKGRQLEVAGQHKSQFLANMSHELRTPLNAIIGYSEILQEDVADFGQEAIVPDLKKIEGAGRHLLGLINDILDLSKVEAGRMEIFLEDVELVPLLEQVCALIVPLAEKNGNTLELRLAEDLGSIRTDRTKLKQSLLNILSNGSKFTENGRLTLVAERFETDRPMVQFAVSDTGIGMTEEQLGRLFQAFSQAEASTTKKYGGTGLGLAISRRFCQLLGGDIAVTSRPGEGSTFTITLPARSEAPARIVPTETARLAADPDNRPSILIVDDDPAARELLAANLKGAGYRLVHAAGGEEALNLARTLRPDAITLDILMPKPDGWDVLNALKADPDLCDIPVIIVTVAPERGIGLSLGAVEVLTKPVDRARLTALINRLVCRDGLVLVVEDDADTRDMMRHTIEKMGLLVAETTNGRQALSWLRDNPQPAIILLDLMMPEMDGFAFLDVLSDRADWREIPVIVVTAKQLTAGERERLARQARKVMEKATATRSDIAAAIGEAVRRRPPRGPAAKS